MPGIPGCKLREQVPGCGNRWWDFGCWGREDAGFGSLISWGKEERDAPGLGQIPSPVQGL